jgi:SulP family sulfate permease
MGQSGFDAAQQPRHFDDLGRAIDHLFYHRIDPAVCIYECEVRAFQECQNLPKRTFPIPRAIAGTMPELPQIAPRLLWAAVNHAPAPCVIDVREPREYARGHIPGALLMPLGAVLAGELAPPRDQPVVLVCRTGRRSQRAAVTLHAQGYADLTILAGGMRAWHDEHLLEALDA